MKKLIVIAVLTIGLSTFAQKPAKNPWKEKVSLNKSVTNNVWKVDLNIKIGQ